MDALRCVARVDPAGRDRSADAIESWADLARTAAAEPAEGFQAAGGLLVGHVFVDVGMSNSTYLYYLILVYCIHCGICIDGMRYFEYGCMVSASFGE